MLLERLTTSPPGGAKPVNVIFPTTLVPPFTVPGANVNVERPAGVTVKEAFVIWAPSIDLIVATLDVGTPEVVTLNAIVLVPGSTFTEAGTWAKVEVVDNVIV